MSATALPTAKVMTKVRGVQLGGVTPRCCGEDGCPGTTCWVWNDSAPVNCIPRTPVMGGVTIMAALNQHRRGDAAMGTAALAVSAGEWRLAEEDFGFGVALGRDQLELAGGLGERHAY